MLVDVKKFLEENGKYDDFYPIALKYQEFTDGTMYTLPLEYHVEMTWYNKEIFDKYELTPPATLLISFLHSGNFPVADIVHGGFAVQEHRLCCCIIGCSETIVNGI